jgi:hypothetical protein
MMSCRSSGASPDLTSGGQLLGDFEVAITGGIWVAAGGRWTAEMFLIFGVGRADVLSVSDAGLQRSARILYGEGTDLSSVAQAWAPWRSVASWYLWRHLDA